VEVKQSLADLSCDIIPVPALPVFPAFEQGRPQVLAALHSFLDDNLTQIQSKSLAGAASRTTVKQLGRMFDQLHQSLFAVATTGLEPAAVSSCALIAVGGYGRDEMNPRSDLDLMFYWEPEGRDAIRIIADRILYLLWDLNLDVGYSIRCASDCLEQASDATVRTSLMDARLIAGSSTVFEDFFARVAVPLLTHDAPEFIRQKLAEREARKKKYGSSVYLLEPNIKEGEGGLRELQDALWIARIKYKAASLHELLTKSIVTEQDVSHYVAAQDYLWTIRNFLHFSGQRKSDQLTFDVQQQIAAHLGYVNKASGSAVEQFMQDYYAQANRNEYLASKIIVDATQSRVAPKGVFNFLVRRNLEDGFYLLRGQLRASKNLTLLQNPALMMVAFELAQRHEVELCLELKQLIRENLHLISDKVRRSKPYQRILHDNSAGFPGRWQNPPQDAPPPVSQRLHSRVQEDLLQGAVRSLPYLHRRYSFPVRCR
jgi:[protein-PII] uridylyltransferase